SGLGCWLDFSIHRFHSELQRLGRQTWGTFTPDSHRFSKRTLLQPSYFVLGPPPLLDLSHRNKARLYLGFCIFDPSHMRKHWVELMFRKWKRVFHWHFGGWFEK